MPARTVSLVEEAVVDVIGYRGGDEFRSLDGNVVDAVLHPDCLSPVKERFCPGYRLFASEATSLWGVLILLARGH